MQDNGFTVDAVNAAIAGDKDAFLTAFNNAISTKVGDALEIKKVEIASNLLGAGDEVATNEVETTETEVDGSSDGEVAAEATAEASAEV